MELGLRRRRRWAIVGSVVVAHLRPARAHCRRGERRRWTGLRSLVRDVNNAACWVTGGTCLMFVRWADHQTASRPVLRDPLAQAPRASSTVGREYPPPASSTFSPKLSHRSKGSLAMSPGLFGADTRSMLRLACLPEVSFLSAAP